MNNKNKNYLTIGLAAILFLTSKFPFLTNVKAESEPSNISSITSTNIEPLIDFSKGFYIADKTNHPSRFYSQKIYDWKYEITKIRKEQGFPLDNLTLDVVYDAYEILNGRYPFSGLSSMQVDIATKNALNFLFEAGTYAGKYSREELKLSTYIEDLSTYQIILNVEKLRDEFNNISKLKQTYGEHNSMKELYDLSIEMFSIDIMDRILARVAEIDEHAYNPIAEIMAMTIFNGALLEIPSNYITREYLIKGVAPVDAKSRQDVLENGATQEVIFVATEEAGNKYTQWTQYPYEGSYIFDENNVVLKRGTDYYGGPFTEEQLKNLTIPKGTVEMGSLRDYGIRALAVRTTNDSLNALYRVIMNQKIKSNNIIIDENFELDTAKKIITPIKKRKV